MFSIGSGFDLMSWQARAVWVLLYSWVLATHVVHVAYMRGQPRAWHLTHMLMAGGMIYMFVPWSGDPFPLWYWKFPFTIAAALIALFVLVQWARGHAVNLLWFLQLIALGAMAFMFALADPTPPAGARWITYGLIGFFLVESAGWSRRAFAEADEQRLSWVPFSVHPRPAGAVCASRLCGRVPVDLALSGTAMGLGMVWMFAAMDYHSATYVAHATSAGHPIASATALVGALLALVLLAPMPNNRRVAVQA